jgi:hypothetical protein
VEENKKYYHIEFYRGPDTLLKFPREWESFKLICEKLFTDFNINTESTPNTFSTLICELEGKPIGTFMDYWLNVENGDQTAVMRLQVFENEIMTDLKFISVIPKGYEYIKREPDKHSGLSIVDIKLDFEIKEEDGYIVPHEPFLS